MSLVPIIVWDDWSAPDGSQPDGSVEFQLDQELRDALSVAPSLVTTTLVAGRAAVPLYANDSPGATPANTQYRYTQNIIGAPSISWWITVPSAPTGSRSVSDAVVSVGSTALTSATAAFTSADVGKYVASPLLPIGTTIASVTNSTTVVLSAAATANGSAQSLLVGASVQLSSLLPF